MGTRNLTEVILDGKVVVAQYGQWDGYPSSAGANILRFINYRILGGELEDFKNKLKECRFINQEELDAKYKALGIESDNGWITLDEAQTFKSRHPQLDRDMGSDVLNFILDSGPCELADESKFIFDDLFCEWAYILDLDNECLEVYGGEGDTYAPTDRFDGGPEKCYKVKFEDLANMSVDDFVKNCGGY